MKLLYIALLHRPCSSSLNRSTYMIMCCRQRSISTLADGRTTAFRALRHCSQVYLTSCSCCRSNRWYHFHAINEGSSCLVTILQNRWCIGQGSDFLPATSDVNYHPTSVAADRAGVETRQGSVLLFLTAEGGIGPRL